MGSAPPLFPGETVVNVIPACKMESLSHSNGLMVNCWLTNFKIHLLGLFKLKFMNLLYLGWEKRLDIAFIHAPDWYYQPQTRNSIPIASIYRVIIIYREINSFPFSLQKLMMEKILVLKYS